MTKTVAEKLRKDILSVDFNLNNKFCNGNDLNDSWQNLPISNEVLVFFSSLFNINTAKLHPNYDKHVDTQKADA